MQEDGYHCIIDGAVNGNPLLMVLDTGASRSCFDIAFLQQFLDEQALQTNDSMTSGIGTNSLNSFITVLDEFSMGSFVLEKYQAVGLDLTHIHEAYKQSWIATGEWNLSVLIFWLDIMQSSIIANGKSP